MAVFVSQTSRAGSTADQLDRHSNDAREASRVSECLRSPGAGIDPASAGDTSQPLPRLSTDTIAGDALAVPGSSSMRASNAALRTSCRITPVPR